MAYSNSIYMENTFYNLCLGKELVYIYGGEFNRASDDFVLMLYRYRDNGF